ncbi:MAG: GNAT family N-acetyltransferase [Chloroflexi bacterium]|nr:GNAT family N-acetyltransferase [Chloroflexota bacterium]
MAILETPRLYMRPPLSSDLQLLAQLWGNPEVMRYLPGSRPRSLEMTHTLLEIMLNHWRQYPYGTWIVTLRADNSWLGYCGVQHLQGDPGVELLYALEPHYWGQGLTFEAARSAVRYAFTAAGLERLMAAVAPENMASRRILAKLGMRHDPTCQHYGPEVWHYTLTRQEFLSG